jgi:short-subunit dehydrogenase
MWLREPSYLPPAANYDGVVRFERGTRVLITGASRGIGRALALRLAERGCTLGLLARSGDELAELSEALPGDGHAALPCDVGDRGQVVEAVERFGRCDVAVANAGVAYYGRFDSLAPELVERMTRVNWLGTLHTAGAVLPGMLERGSGHLVVVSSGAGYRAFPEAAVYGGTKAAQRAFGEALRHELAGSGVSVTVVYPGETATALHDHEKDSMPEWYRSKDSADPGELAERVVAAVEKDRAAVHYPPAVAALRVTHGLSPRVADFLLRLARGPTVAPRRG